MSGWICLAVLWMSTGLWLTGASRSRGAFADALFVFTWPLHVVLYFLGRDA